jgi:hypothetical protein
MEGAPLRSRLRQNHLRRQDHTDVLGVDCPGGLQRHKSLRLFAAEVVGLARICFEIERLSKGDSAFGFSRVCGAWERAFLLKRPVLFMNFGSGGAYALDGIGEVSGMSCPECGGALWELSVTPPRFRCHTGHSFTCAALFQSQDETVEEALWVAIRALHEKQLLLGRLIRSSKDAGRDDASQEYELASEGLESHKATLRALVASRRAV